MNDTTKNFWQAWNDWQPTEHALTYRLYHDDEGYPLFYTMEDLPGAYIEIDQVAFAKSSVHVRVVNGQLVYIDRSAPLARLRPSQQGTACHPRDVCVVVGDGVEHVKWSKDDNS